MAHGNPENSSIQKTADTNREVDHSSSAALPNIDRNEMFKESAKPTRAVAEPKELSFDNIYEKTSSTSGHRGGAPANPDDVGVPVKDPKAKANGPAHLRTQPGSIDPTKRNALVIDSFNDQKGDLDHVLNTRSHGGLIAEGMKKNGFNVFTADANAKVGAASGQFNFGPVFKDVVNQVEAGKLPLKSGDVVTASFGNSAERDGTGGDPTFQQASIILKMKLDPSNIKENTPEIIKRLGQVAQGHDPETGKPVKTPDFVQERARFATESNAAIKKLQDKGITVIAAAGNDGPDRLSLDTLGANVRLSSNDKEGKLDGFSGADNGTKKADGVLPLTATAPSLFDTTKIEEQKERVRVGDSGMVLPAAADKKATLDMHREKFAPNYVGNSKVTSRAQEAPQPSLVLSPDGALPIPMDAAIPQTGKFSGNQYPGDASKVTEAAKLAAPAEPYGMRQNPGRLVGVEAGTSFSVLDYTKGKAPRTVPLDQ